LIEIDKLAGFVRRRIQFNPGVNAKLSRAYSASV
jgi:hypothetical protein